MIKTAVVLLGVILIFSSISSSYADNHIAPPPKKQMHDGVLAQDVQCNVGLQLMLKYNGGAACVKPSSALRLATAGWGSIGGEVVTELPETTDTMELEENISLEEESESEEDKPSYRVELAETIGMGN